MPSAELAPAPQPEMQEIAAERFPHFGIPGFEKLPRETQNLYLKIPADRLEAARPLIENEIAKNANGSEVISAGEAETSQSSAIESTAIPRKAQSLDAIETFHRAESGDPEAKKELMDQKKELLGEEPTDDEIFQTILETNSSNPFAQDTAMEVMLSDSEAQAHQDVLDLFKEFRGDLASVDDALKPQQQIDLFIELTKGQGTLAERMFFARKALTILTGSGERNLFEGLTSLHVLSSGEIAPSGVKALLKMADTPAVAPSHDLLLNTPNPQNLRQSNIS